MPSPIQTIKRQAALSNPAGSAVRNGVPAPRAPIPTLRPGENLQTPLTDVIAQLLSKTISVDRVPAPIDFAYFASLEAGPCAFPLWWLTPGDNMPELVLNAVTTEMLPADVDGTGADPGATFSVAPLPFGSVKGRGAGIVVGKNLPIRTQFDPTAIPDGSRWQKLPYGTIPFPGLSDETGAATTPGEWSDNPGTLSAFDMSDWRFFGFPPGKLSDSFVTRPIIPKGFGPCGLRISKGETLAAALVVHPATFRTLAVADTSLYMHAAITLDFARVTGSVQFAG